ncbi:MAG: hypothetical protein PHG69_00055 [Candidatus Omnitrophica bacterium]|nr:hypothetical protein [Candidatus Omnitrophota bacterium]
MKKEIIKFDDVKSIMQFLKQPTIKIAEALTGILASDMKDWKFSAGKIVQATIKGDLLTQLGREIEKYQKEGKIKEDYLKSDIDRASFKELLKFIDKETPDEIRFRAMKSIFLVSIGNRDGVLAHELLQICKQLSSMEIMILSANYNVVKETAKPTASDVTSSATKIEYWAQIIAEQIGHNLSEIVLQYEDHLITLKLISDRHYPIDRTRVTKNFDATPYFRLTPLGHKLCEFITKYE